MSGNLSSPPTKRFKPNHEGKGSTDPEDDLDAVEIVKHIDDVMVNIFSYMKTVPLIQIKPVCKDWQRLCTLAIDMKCGAKKAFETNEELRSAAAKYYGEDDGWVYMAKHAPFTEDEAEGIASLYGYPIGRWDVSNVMNFSHVFGKQRFFNEPIGSWDVSNATDLKGMFCFAPSFNQDISSWDVSKVKCMSAVFLGARSFNQDISGWDVSNVDDMLHLFWGAESFNQDISMWNMSTVINKEDMRLGDRRNWRLFL